MGQRIGQAPPREPQVRSKNEAAERLRHDFRKFEDFEDDFDAALDWERRRTVEPERLAKLMRDHCHDSADEGMPILLRHKHLDPFVRADCAESISRAILTESAETSDYAAPPVTVNQLLDEGWTPDEDESAPENAHTVRFLAPDVDA